MATKRKRAGGAQDHIAELERRYNTIDQKLDAIAHVRVNGSIGIEPALKTIYDTAKEAHTKIDELRTETEIVRDAHKVYMVYKKYAPIRWAVRLVFIYLIGHSLGIGVMELAKLLK